MGPLLQANDVIRILKLEPLQGEGGHFRQTYFTGNSEGPNTTAIYYLITPDSFSSLHLLDQDELFHFYAGDPCEMIQIDAEGQVSQVQIGVDLAAGYRPQVLVPGGTWQATRLEAGGAWALLGTTMTPGFTVGAFHIADPTILDSIEERNKELVASFLAR